MRTVHPLMTHSRQRASPLYFFRQIGPLRVYHTFFTRIDGYRKPKATDDDNPSNYHQSASRPMALPNICCDAKLLYLGRKKFRRLNRSYYWDDFEFYQVIPFFNPLMNQINVCAFHDLITHSTLI